MKIYLPFLLMMSIHSFAMDRKKAYKFLKVEFDQKFESNGSNISSKENELVEIAKEQQMIIDYYLEDFWRSSASDGRSAKHEELEVSSSCEVKKLDVEMLREDLYKVEQAQALRRSFFVSRAKKIQCGCGIVFANNYSSAFHHVSKKHSCSLKKKVWYECLFPNCDKKSAHAAHILHHWKKHKIFMCCRYLMTHNEFIEHRKHCSKILVKKRKFA